MSTRYTRTEKDRAQQLLVDHSPAEVHEQTGIPVRTLQRWKAQSREQRAASLLAQIETLHAQLAANAVQLAQAIDAAADGAPLNQLSSALGTVIDRYLKIDEHLQTAVGRSGEHIVRIEYQDPDGTIHDTPLWARNHSDRAVSSPGGGVWPPVWQDFNRSDRDNGSGLARSDDVVAGPHLYDDESGLAGSENGSTQPASIGD